MRGKISSLWLPPEFASLFPVPDSHDMHSTPRPLRNYCPGALIFLFALIVTVTVSAEETVIIFEFEEAEEIAKTNTTHASSISLIEDAPDGGGRYSVKTVVSDDAGAATHFGAGFHLAPIDLSQA
ncbi:MAG: hypothetical protein AAGC68_13645, partial [Verrucomicrobiota bacterium]